MFTQDTGKLPGGGNYEGPPIHTLTVFANPFIEVLAFTLLGQAIQLLPDSIKHLQDIPSIFEEGVHGVIPGEVAPTEGDWNTLVFLPGVHDIGLNFRLHANRFHSNVKLDFFHRSYYIPGDAIVYGTMNNGGKEGHEPHQSDGDNIRWFWKWSFYASRYLEKY